MGPISTRSRSPLTIASTRSVRARATRSFSLDRGLLGRVVDDRRVPPDALDELTDGSLADVRGEPRAPQHQLELDEQQRAGDELDAVVHERRQHEIGCATAAAR
jgi:hypothetical protein